jgi:hypothetical protein
MDSPVEVIIIVKTNVIVQMTLHDDSGAVELDSTMDEKYACIYAPVVEQTFLKQNATDKTRKFGIYRACRAINCEGNDDCIVQKRKPSC